MTLVLRCCSQNFAVHKVDIMDGQQVLKGNIDRWVLFCPLCGKILEYSAVIDDVPYTVSRSELERLTG